jgi:hypothetical protein
VEAVNTHALRTDEETTVKQQRCEKRRQSTRHSIVNQPEENDEGIDKPVGRRGGGVFFYMKESNERNIYMVQTVGWSVNDVNT